MTDLAYLTPPDAGTAGARLLDTVHDFLGRFVAYPSAAAHIAHTLWIAHTHLMDAWESTPRIAFLSPEPGSGKTRALEATELLVPRPVEAVNVTPAYLFRKVGDEAGAPTILFDEIDTVFGPKAKDNEEIRGLLNAGHRRGAVAGRCVVRGKLVETEEIPAYCAVALAGLNDMPDTIMTRSVVINMRRRSPSEKVEPYRRRLHAPDGHAIRDQLEAWGHAVLPVVDGAYPDMPDGVTDRPADVWEPLLAVADAAGGGWPDKARVSCVTLVTLSMGGAPTLGVRLLQDVRDVFGDAEAMFTEDLLKALHAIDEAPWDDLRGKALNARALAQRLRQYDVKSKTVRIGDATAKGYSREDLHDPWTRYLPPPVCRSDAPLDETSRGGEKGDRAQQVGVVGPSPYESVTSVTPDTAQVAEVPPTTYPTSAPTTNWSTPRTAACSDGGRDDPPPLPVHLRPLGRHRGAADHRGLPDPRPGSRPGGRPMTDYPPHSVDQTVQADAIDLLDHLRAARAEVQQVRQLRAAGEVGYADLTSAQYRHAMALQRARDAGLVVDRFTVDTSAVLHHPDPGDGTYEVRT